MIELALAQEAVRGGNKPVSAAPKPLKQIAVAGTGARGIKFKSKLEMRYADWLDRRKSRGEIYDWDYEPFKIRIGEVRCWYTPDFLVYPVDENDKPEFHETKGWDREPGRTKFQSAVRQYRRLFRFFKVTANGPGFNINEA